PASWRGSGRLRRLMLGGSEVAEGARELLLRFSKLGLEAVDLSLERLRPLGAGVRRGSGGLKRRGLALEVRHLALQPRHLPLQMIDLTRCCSGVGSRLLESSFGFLIALVRVLELPVEIARVGLQAILVLDERSARFLRFLIELVAQNRLIARIDCERPEREH